MTETILLTGSCARRLRYALEHVRGLEFIDGYRGVLSIGSDCADVRLEAADGIHVRLPVQLTDSPTSALVANSDLPGNVRFARDEAGVALLADTQVDGEFHLTETRRGLRSGFRTALGHNGLASM